MTSPRKRKTTETTNGTPAENNYSTPEAYADQPDAKATTHRKKGKVDTETPVRVYCDGIYDLFHFGHARSLEQAKKAFPNVYLLVGVCNDELTHTMKGKTVMNARERAESVRNCKWVDEVVENAPWIIDQEFLDAHKIDYVAHDDAPYQSNGVDDVYAFVKEQGKFVATQRTEGVSTSELITRIVKDYDSYVRRNLDRGVSAKDLNIGFLKEKEYQVKKSLGTITDQIKNKFKESEELIAYWEDKSQEYTRGFLKLFGSEGPVSKLWKKPAVDDKNNEKLPSPVYQNPEENDIVDE